MRYPFFILAFCGFFVAKQTAAQNASFHPGRLTLSDSIPLSFGSVPVLPVKKFKPIVSQPLSVRSVLLPSAMILYGAFTINSKGLKKINEEVRAAVWEDRANGAGRTIKLDNYTLLAPAAAVYGLNLAGIRGRHNFVDRSMVYAMSNLIGSGITSSVKRMTGVMRPDSSNRLSFPSGHTSKAFIAAEFMRQEYKHRSPWYGVAGYAMAVGTGFLRMYNNKHWLNDVVAGAGVGIISTRVSYWLYPKIKSALFPRYKGATVVLPLYQEGSYGIGVMHQF